jgi:hypothetical protein
VVAEAARVADETYDAYVAAFEAAECLEEVCRRSPDWKVGKLAAKRAERAAKVAREQSYAASKAARRAHSAWRQVWCEYKGE